MSKIQFGDRFVFFDGATGTQLQEMGLAPGHAPSFGTWSAPRRCARSTPLTWRPGPR